MNSLMQEHASLFESTQELRRDLLDVLTDADLTYRLPGRNLTLGALCQEMGEIEQSYIDGFKTFKQDYSYRHPDAEVATRVEKLRAWYDALDQELKTTLESLSEADLQKQIDRGYGFTPTVPANFHIYREALLIFYAKAHIYVKALEKSVPTKWRWWIGDRADWESEA
ncbi:MAG: DinB family protein [Anaerolineae bacterium]|nr:DinB family protein [Anaerolineae bacterium]